MTVKTTIGGLKQQRDELLARWDTVLTTGSPAELNELADAINTLHDAIDDLEQGARFVGSDKGDWNDRSSRWHY